MIDIHSHILYNVDDGPKSKEETIEMLEQAVQEGISEIISTSHALSSAIQCSSTNGRTTSEDITRRNDTSTNPA